MPGCRGQSGTPGKDSELGQPGVPGVKGQKVKLLEWINLKIKLKMASNLFIHRCKIVAIKISIIVSNMRPMIRSHVHDMERYILIYKVVICKLLLLHFVQSLKGKTGVPGPQRSAGFSA